VASLRGKKKSSSRKNRDVILKKKKKEKKTPIQKGGRAVRIKEKMMPETEGGTTTHCAHWRGWGGRKGEAYRALGQGGRGRVRVGGLREKGEAFSWPAEGER